MHFCKIKSVLEKAGFLGGVSATPDIVSMLHQTHAYPYTLRHHALCMLN